MNTPPKPLPDKAAHDQIVRNLRRAVTERQQGYRERALKLFPHICANCGREFSGKRLRELTVHHKDHDYTNNPPDGSNWELLCLYCHDHEHDKKSLTAYHGGGRREEARPGASVFQPFAALDGLDAIRSELPSGETAVPADEPGPVGTGTATD